MSELRWNPILEEWVITATHRQDRTFLPPKDYCPLCPTKSGAFETEIPIDSYDMVVFENKFPSLQRNAPEPAIKGDDFYRVKKARGICEVIVYTQKHNTTLADESVDRIYRLIEVWKDRYIELGKLPYIKYVFIFENKGIFIGVTLNHPHGQIYAFPYIPPRINKELSGSLKYWRKNKRCIFCDILKRERKSKRLVFENKNFSAVIPFYARWPYEIHIFSRKHMSSIAEFNESQMLDLAEILKIVMKKLDKFFGFSTSYMMVLHQNPTDGKKRDYYHFHIEFYPPNRTKEKLKYLAGCETGAGSFINDTLAEEKAVELRNVEVEI